MDKYFDKLKDENYRKYIAPVLFADKTLKIAEAFLSDNCKYQKQKFTGLYEYQKEFLLNLSSDKDFVVRKPRCCGATVLLAAHIANKIISRDYGITDSGEECLNIMMVFPNHQTIAAFINILKQCLYLSDYNGSVKRFDQKEFVDMARNIHIKFASALSDIYSKLCCFRVDEFYFDEYAFMDKKLVEETCMLLPKARKVFITTPDKTLSVDVKNIVSNDHIFQNICWYEVPRYKESGIWAYKTEKLTNPTKKEIEERIKDGWEITSPEFQKFKGILGASFINELNDYTYGRKEKN